MKAITIRQPWAWAISQGAEFPQLAKMVENRRRGFPARHRGTVAIHAAVSWSKRGGADERVKSLWVQGATWGMVGDLTPDRFTLGAVIAVADVADVHVDTGCCRPWGETGYDDADGHHVTEVLHLVFDRVEEIDPITTRGYLGLWNLPPEVEAQVLPQLTGWPT